MTIREYILQKLHAWNITEAQFADVIIETNLELDADYTADNAQIVGKSMVGILEELALSPYMDNVNENGFSVSWDYSKIGQYYIWLCHKYGIDPDSDVVAALGLSTITDRSDIW